MKELVLHNFVFKLGVVRQLCIAHAWKCTVRAVNPSISLNKHNQCYLFFSVVHFMIQDILLDQQSPPPDPPESKHV